MRATRSSAQSKAKAKAKLSGVISSEEPQNKKIVFDDDGDDDADGSDVDPSDDENGSDDDVQQSEHDGSDADYDDDAVEEVKGTTARASTQRLRAAERKVAKESIVPKKKRTKKSNVTVDAPDSDIESEGSVSGSKDEEEDDLLTDDFFKMVDSERADNLQKAKQEKKQKKIDEKKRLGRHTTFVVEDDYKLVNEPKKLNQNIEVVAIGTEQNDQELDDERQILISARLGSAPSKSATAFARGSLTQGASTKRSSESRKRKSKDDEAWKRSRKMNSLSAGSRPGFAAALFTRKS